MIFALVKINRVRILTRFKLFLSVFYGDSLLVQLMLTLLWDSLIFLINQSYEQLLILMPFQLELFGNCGSCLNEAAYAGGDHTGSHFISGSW